MSRLTARHLATVACGCVALGVMVNRGSSAPPGPAALETRTAQTVAPRTGALIGAVRGADGQPLGGVQVSAKAAGTTITTTVFTDEQGRYFFPAMRNGTYRVWAQAVGFARVPADVTVAPGVRTRRAFTLRALRTFDELAPQLSESE